PDPFLTDIFYILPLLPPFPTRRSSDIRWSGTGSTQEGRLHQARGRRGAPRADVEQAARRARPYRRARPPVRERPPARVVWATVRDRKSTRLNSSHVSLSYAVFCLKTKK